MELHVVLLASHELIHVVLAETDVVLRRLQALQETHVERHARVLLLSLLLLVNPFSRSSIGHLLGLLLLLGWGFAVGRARAHETAHCLMANFRACTKRHASHDCAANA